MFTHSEKQVYDFIKTRIDETGGVCPTFSEIGQHVGLKSKSGVHRILTQLETKGFIVRMKVRKQAIAIVEKNAVDLTCPHCQQVIKIGVIP